MENNENDVELDPMLGQAEMTREDHELILSFLKKKKPKKILEIGVSAGGTTCLLLDAIDKDAELFSVDLHTHYYRDKTKEIGYLAKDHYNPERHPKWHAFFGKDIYACVEEIGNGIDFVVLDTVHIVPGEFLSFLSVFPFLDDKAVLVLHDLSLHILYQYEGRQSLALHVENCNGLLFNAIFSRDKTLSEATVPNCGAIVLDKTYVMDNLFMVINMLFTEWKYLPSNDILLGTLNLVRKHYPLQHSLLIEKAMILNVNRIQTANSQRA